MVKAVEKKPTLAGMTEHAAYLQRELEAMTESRDDHKRWWHEEKERSRMRDADISKLVAEIESLKARASEADRLRGMIDGFERAGILPNPAPHVEHMGYPAEHIRRTMDGYPR